MFADCTALVCAPELPALYVDTGSYNGMFKGCTSLKYVKAMFTDYDNIPKDWLNGVSMEGTFVMNKSAEWDASPKGGIIPKGWSVVYSE